jgi:hypothetical protein
MSNLTQIIGGQPYYNATAGNEKNNLLDFWKGTQVQYDYLKQINGTTSVAPAATVITFTVTSTAYFTVGKRVYVTATSGNNLSRTPGTVTSITNATDLVITFDVAYNSSATTGYTIDCYLPETLYLIIA